MNTSNLIFNKPFCLLLLTVMFIVSCDFSKKEIDKKRIIFVGDLLLDRGVRERIEHLGIGDLFHATIDSVFAESDIVIANLECPATKIEEPINKKYIFRAEPEWLPELKNHGITHLNMANNHVMDQGRKGLIDTKINILNSGLIPLGVGNNLEEACKPQLITNSPRKVYILSSLQVPSENWPFLEDKPCVCEHSFDAIAKQIKELKNNEPDSVIIVQLHWGAEHISVPLTSQKQQARILINSGADGIIGHHSHTIQSIEYYKGNPIYYSIGNFIFDQSDPINSKGLMIQIEVTKSQVVFKDTRFNIKSCVPML
ncbi:CapA family protein [Aquimarina sp. 2304DJ70-9]|uniref:CapA family protein n=1 Tax=Aquimarina penaris TaxID=3231044 RepID=UPI003461DDFB